jgi:acetyl esterase/lipase
MRSVAFWLLLLAAALSLAPAGTPAERAWTLGGRPVPGPLPPNTSAEAPEVEVRRNVLYGDSDPDLQRLDLAKPVLCRDQRVPLAVYIHGGGWSAGDKGGILDRGDAKMLLQMGFAVASVNYRLAPEARWPAQVHDCKLAIRFLRKNAVQFGIDPDRIGVFGDSAGGHLSTLLATAGESDGLEGPGLAGISSRVQAAVDRFGPADLTDIRAGATAEQLKTLTDLLGCGPLACPGLAWNASPAAYVSSEDTPLLIQHGDKDTLVPFRQSEILAELYRAAGAPCALIQVKNAGHGFLPSPITAALSPGLDMIAFQTVAHLGRLLEPGLFGDLNLDGRRTGGDFRLLGRCLGFVGVGPGGLPADGNWNPLADLVLDGVVNELDLRALLGK